MKKEIILLSICWLLSGCGGGGSESDSDTDDTNVITNNSSTGIITTYQPATTTGRLLASNCFQCHGTNGTGGFEHITGGEASEVYDYLTQTADTDIMAAHAQGYTQAQLDALVGYLNQIQ